MASTISHSRLIVVERNYIARRAGERARRIARARENLSRARSEPVLAPQRDQSSLAVPLFWMAAVGLHGAVAFAAMQVPPSQHETDDKIQVRVVNAPPAPIVEPEPLPVEAPPLPEVPAPPPPTVKKKAAVKPEPVPEPVAPAPMTIVGLTLESTSSGGGGAAFAVGSTLAGSTERVARAAQTKPPVQAPVPSPVAAPSRNRVAAPRPPAGVRVEAAKRLSRVEPSYPALLQSQRIEGDVTVRVELDGEGRVQRVEIVRGASEAAFNDAALAAANNERFSPETHDGRPVATSITYTYRFRISQ